MKIAQVFIGAVQGQALPYNIKASITLANTLVSIKCTDILLKHIDQVLLHFCEDNIVIRLNIVHVYFISSTLTLLMVHIHCFMFYYVTECMADRRQTDAADNHW